MLIKAGPLADAAVRLDRERGHIPTSVVGHEQRFAGLVPHQVARSASPSVDLVDKSERAGFTIDGVTADRTVFLITACSRFLTHLGGGVQKAMLRIGGHEGRIRLLSCHANRGELSTVWIKPIVVNPLAVGR